MEVRACYDFFGSFTLDDAATKAAGRNPDFSGSGVGLDNPTRDLGWVCKSEIEAERIKMALRKIGLHAVIHQ